MFSRTFFKLVLSTLVATIVVGIAVQVSQVQAKPVPKSLRFEGVLVDLNAVAGTAAIRIRTREVVIVSMNGNTKIERNGFHTSLATFRLGDRVEARLASATSNLAIKFEGSGP